MDSAAWGAGKDELDKTGTCVAFQGIINHAVLSFDAGTGGGGGAPPRRRLAIAAAVLAKVQTTEAMCVTKGD